MNLNTVLPKAKTQTEKLIRKQSFKIMGAIIRGKLLQSDVKEIERLYKQYAKEHPQETKLNKERMEKVEKFKILAK